VEKVKRDRAKKEGRGKKRVSDRKDNILAKSICSV
jgi:hypothetical protein